MIFFPSRSQKRSSLRRSSLWILPPHGCLIYDNIYIYIYYPTMNKNIRWLSIFGTGSAEKTRLLKKLRPALEQVWSKIHGERGQWTIPFIDFLWLSCFFFFHFCRCLLKKTYLSHLWRKKRVILMTSPRSIVTQVGKLTHWGNNENGSSFQNPILG